MTDAVRDTSRFWLGRMAVAGLAVATAAIAIGFGLAPWWAVIIPAVLSAVAGPLLVHDPPSYSAAEANVPSRDSYDPPKSEEHPSELQSLMRNSYAVFCLKKTRTNKTTLR